MRMKALTTYEDVVSERDARRNRAVRNVFVYCRSSTDDPQRVERQDEQCVEFARRKFPDASVEVFRDNAESGGSEDRQQFSRMRDLARAGKCDALVTWHPSRLARDVIISETLARELSTILDEIWLGDTERPVSIKDGETTEWRNYAVRSAEQLDLSRKGSRNALERNARDGVPFGVAPFGYRNIKGPDGRADYEIVPDRAALVRRIFAEAASGATYGALVALANESGVKTATGNEKWTPQTIKSMLTNLDYVGRMVWAGIDFQTKGRWEPIVDDETFDKAQVIVEQRRNKAKGTRRRSSRKWWVSEILICEGCGGKMTGGRGGNNPVLACKGEKCTNRMRFGPAELVERHFAAEVVARLNTPTVRKAISERDQSFGRRDELQAARAAQLTKIEQMDDLLADGAMTMDRWHRQNERLTETLKEIEIELEALDIMSPPSDLAGKLDLTIEEFEAFPLKEKVAVAKSVIVSAMIVKGSRKGYDPRTGTLNQSRFGEIVFRDEF